MVYLKFNYVLLINFVSIIKVSLLETVHFTNSPNKILHANNYTTYKVEVPNGDPITIIEANTPLIDKNIKFNEVDDAKYSIKQNGDGRNHVMKLKTSLSMTVTPHNNNNNNINHVRYENSPAGEEESVTNDYNDLSPEHAHHHHTMKTVYSPELLEKFLKDYANKVQASTESSTQEPFKHPLTINDDDMRDKYESIEADPDEEIDANRRVSSVNEEQESAGPEDVQERKHYRPGGGNFQHPYNKNNGWVTLEAVPWSKSKVSKWQSSIKPYTNQNSYNYQNQGNYNRPPQSPNRPSYSYDEDNDNDSDYYQQKPNRPTFQNNHFYGSGPSSSGGSNRPTGQDSQYSHSSHHSGSFNSHNNHNGNYDADYNQRPNRPFQPEIITDNRPSNFPSHHESSHNSNEYNRPSSYERPNRPHNDYHYSGGQSYNNYQNKDGHPLTYPTGADGEWVLVSTTKGYQFPKRHGQRAMVIKAQNGVDGTETRKTDHKGIITAASNQYETTVSLRPPYQVGPTKMTQQQVKLTVLPLFKKPENRPHQTNYNNMDVSLYKPSNSYNGIIETEPSSQTIEESVAAAASANGANAIASAQNLPKKKRKHTKNYAVMRKNAGSDSTAVLAAVGAGLLPASMGLIAPMLLGK